MNQNQSSALLVIDVQQELFQKSTKIFQADILLANIRALIERAHQAEVPVIYVQHESGKMLVRGTDGWQLHPSLQPRQDELIIHKQHGSSFEGTSLDSDLHNRGITHLIVCGLVTQGCVKAGCQDALKRGFRVTLASDAHSNWSKDAAEIIAAWNKTLAEEGAEVIETKAIIFTGE